jgi:hypothetical protein
MLSERCFVQMYRSLSYAFLYAAESPAYTAPALPSVVPNAFRRSIHILTPRCKLQNCVKLCLTHPMLVDPGNRYGGDVLPTPLR